MLTTFNDIDMGPRHGPAHRIQKKPLRRKHDVSLGFMSFFVKACVTGLQEIPENQRLYPRR